MAGVERTTGRITSYTSPAGEAPNTSRAAPSTLELPPGLRRRTETGHVAGTSRQSLPPARTSGLPPLAQPQVPQIIHNLSTRVPDVAQTIMAIRGRTLALSTAEQHLPGLSVLIQKDGFWRPLKDLKAASSEMTGAGHQEGVFRLIGEVNSLIAGRATGGAGASTAAHQQPTPQPSPTRPANVATDGAGPSMPAPPVPVRFGLAAASEGAPPRPADGPKLEIPAGIELSQLSDDWWTPVQAAHSNAVASQPPSGLLKIEIPEGIDLNQLGDEWWDRTSPKGPSK